MDTHFQSPLNFCTQSPVPLDNWNDCDCSIHINAILDSDHSLSVENIYTVNSVSCEWDCDRASFKRQYLLYVCRAMLATNLHFSLKKKYIIQCFISHTHTDTSTHSKKPKKKEIERNILKSNIFRMNLTEESWLFQRCKNHYEWILLHINTHTVPTKSVNLWINILIFISSWGCAINKWINSIQISIKHFTTEKLIVSLDHNSQFTIHNSNLIINIESVAIVHRK